MARMGTSQASSLWRTAGTDRSVSRRRCPLKHPLALTFSTSQAMPADHLHRIWNIQALRVRCLAHRVSRGFFGAVARHRAPSAGAPPQPSIGPTAAALALQLRWACHPHHCVIPVCPDAPSCSDGPSGYSKPSTPQKWPVELSPARQPRT